MFWKKKKIEQPKTHISEISADEALRIVTEIRNAKFNEVLGHLWTIVNEGTKKGYTKYSTDVDMRAISEEDLQKIISIFRSKGYEAEKTSGSSFTSHRVKIWIDEQKMMNKEFSDKLEDTIGVKRR